MPCSCCNETHTCVANARQLDIGRNLASSGRHACVAIRCPRRNASTVLLTQAAWLLQHTFASTAYKCCAQAKTKGSAVLSDMFCVAMTHTCIVASAGNWMSAKVQDYHLRAIRCSTQLLGVASSERHACALIRRPTQHERQKNSCYPATHWRRLNTSGAQK